MTDNPQAGRELEGLPDDLDPDAARLAEAMREETQLLNQSPTVVAASLEHAQNRVIQLNVRVRQLEAELETVRGLGEALDRTPDPSDL